MTATARRSSRVLEGAAKAEVNRAELKGLMDFKSAKRTGNKSIATENAQMIGSMMSQTRSTDSPVEKPRASKKKIDAETIVTSEVTAPTNASGEKRTWAERVAIAEAAPPSTRINFLEPKPGAKKRKVKTPPPPRMWESRSDPGDQPGDKRKKKWLEQPPDGFERVYDRALGQRMFIINRERDGTEDHPTERMTIAGSTGNLYTVVIDQAPKCNCPALMSRCKHVIYAMVRVLHIPEYMQYQQRFLRSELVEIFRNAPPIIRVAAVDKEDNPNRKPIEDDTECAICYELFDESQETVYCKAACGNNLHLECMDKWIESNRANATCPYCRALWESDAQEDPLFGYTGGTIVREGLKTDGYMNIGAQLGLNSKRDTSTYR